MIRGHVGQDELFLGNSTLMTVTLISRKASLMGGIIDTGIDDDGSVSNFVETEQIVEINENFISFILVRGSVPCFWDRVDDKLNDLTQLYEIEIQREFEMHDTAFKLHLKDLIESYQKVVLINLLDDQNNHELALIKFYEIMLKKYKDKLKRCLKYQHYNYNKENMTEDAELNPSLKTSADVMKFFWINKKGVVSSRQK